MSSIHSDLRYFPKNLANAGMRTNKWSYNIFMQCNCIMNLKKCSNWVTLKANFSKNPVKTSLVYLAGKLNLNSTFP